MLSAFINVHFIPITGERSTTWLGFGWLMKKLDALLKALLMVVLLGEQVFFTSARAGDHQLLCIVCFAAQQFHNITGYYFTDSVTVITFTKFHEKTRVHFESTFIRF